MKEKIEWPEGSIALKKGDPMEPDPEFIFDEDRVMAVMHDDPALVVRRPCPVCLSPVSVDGCEGCGLTLAEIDAARGVSHGCQN